MFVSKTHNHHACVLRAKQVVAERLSTAPTKMNENDARVLDILTRDHRAFGAYEIANQASDVVKKLQPNQVYRAVEKLTELGLVHRIETANGYILCQSTGTCSTPIFLICESCGQISEAQSAGVEQAIDQSTRQSEFQPHHQHVEVTGLCPNCQ